METLVFKNLKKKSNDFSKSFPGGTSGKEPICQCRRHKRHRFNPQVRKIPWRRAWQPTPIFLPGESYGQRNLVGYSLQDCKASDTTEATQHTSMLPFTTTTHYQQIGFAMSQMTRHKSDLATLVHNCSLDLKSILQTSSWLTLALFWSYPEMPHLLTILSCQKLINQKTNQTDHRDHSII